MSTSYLRPFARFQAALAWARCRAISALCASRSFFSLCWKYSFVTHITMMITVVNASSETAPETSIPFMALLAWWSLGLVTIVLGNIIFHWLLVPFIDWLVERLP
jgi:hypothetical protein